MRIPEISMLSPDIPKKLQNNKIKNLTPLAFGLLNSPDVSFPHCGIGNQF